VAGEREESLISEGVIVNRGTNQVRCAETALVLREQWGVLLGGRRKYKDKKPKGKERGKGIRNRPRDSASKE